MNYCIYKSFLILLNTIETNIIKGAQVTLKRIRKMEMFFAIKMGSELQKPIVNSFNKYFTEIINYVFSNNPQTYNIKMLTTLKRMMRIWKRKIGSKSL